MNVASFSLAAPNDKPTMVIKHVQHDPAMEALQAYQHDLMRLVLDQTKDEYGGYTISPIYIGELSVKRQAMLLAQGEEINILWNSPGSVVESAYTTPIPTDIFQGLLGYRVCLINSSNDNDYTMVVDIPSLAHLKIGQVFGWTDLEIYQFNKINVTQAKTFEGLLGMLAANRFNCLLLGAGEIETIYQQKRATMPMLAIENTLLVYYDFPIYFYISNKEPLLIERFKKGMKKVEANGDLMRLFNRYYKDKIAPLNIANRRIICVKSPYLPLTNQCKNIQAILEKFSQ